MRTNSFI